MEAIDISKSGKDTLGFSSEFYDVEWDSVYDIFFVYKKWIVVYLYL